MAIIGSDQVTIVDLTDGVSIVMSPESYAFPATSAGAAVPASMQTKISAFVGTTPNAASVVLSEVTAPSGVTVTSDNNASTPTLTIAVAASVTSNGVVAIPVHVGDLTITKIFAFSLVKAGTTGTAGTNGVSSTNAIIGNENVTIPTDSAGKTTSAISIVIPFAAYTGATRVAATIAATGLPTGWTLGTNTAATTSADGSLTVNIASGTTIAMSGNVTLTITAASTAFPKRLSYARAAQGADAIVMAVTSSNGTVFKNTAIATTLTAHIYQGGVELTAAQINALGVVKWYKDGGTTAVNTGINYVLDAGAVTNKATYVAQLEG